MLKELYAFRSLSDQDIQRIAAAAELVELAPGEKLRVTEGDYAPLYVVITGRVMVGEDVSGNVRESPYPYKAGQFFGADKLLFDYTKRLTATAVVKTRLLELSVVDLKMLLTGNQPLVDGFLFARRMRQWMQIKALSWIDDEELVYMISRKHPFLLVNRLILPALVIMGSFLLYSLSVVLEVSSFRVVSLWASIGVFILGIFWAVWRFIDWGNDYYVVTDKRVVWVEQVLGVYESRREAFLISIRNKQTRTANWFERQFDYGDILMTVYAGQIVFKNIPNPSQVSQLIDYLVRKSAIKLKQDDIHETERLIQNKIADLDTTLAEFVHPLPLPPTPKPVAGKPLLPNWKDFRAYFRLDTRFVQGEVITYRTHRVFLVVKLILPVLTQIFVLSFAVWQLWKASLGQPTWLTIPTLILVTIFANLFIIGWELYHFSDWRNDIYQIAPDKVLDKDHKPFRQETVVQAFLEDIQSMEVERENFFQMLFNFGTVVINSGTDQRLTFDKIPDPTHALQDIYARLFQIQRSRQLKDMRQQQEQAAFAVAVYDRMKKQETQKSAGDSTKQ